MCLSRSDLRRVRISVAVRLRHLDPDSSRRPWLLARYGTPERIVRAWIRAQADGWEREEWLAHVLDVEAAE